MLAGKRHEEVSKETQHHGSNPRAVVDGDGARSALSLSRSRTTSSIQNPALRPSHSAIQTSISLSGNSWTDAFDSKRRAGYNLGRSG
ncbi:uncharacterized protein ColSpa_03887 [Colletotrichum spaethianum]|uniref:Uncharacterized protein n=1 Tax=Colletotrichum spaethianum TaxID=700344 RepID=A0AA37L7Z6_9PEZI|nr:uncharacterized protein ColSpa_03887 [Colletotrichum spaethianum]GKT43706.1 hypothetical protein ColSpa_03887 [Colletotrichum spaethianum]